ncbi:MAG: TetR/AcrR family transcriptional regulator [Chloroflexota bacterium]|nr:TetR/AcrR family transcriptional regulator [Chloroflexota bacterium]
MARTPKVIEDRREQIMDAALRVFAQKGFAGATNRDIAREAAITPGLIYHYFSSKEALFTAIVAERSPLQVARTLPSAILDQPPQVLLETLVKQILVVAEGEQFVQLIRIFLPELLHNPTVVPDGVAGLSQMAPFLERCLVAKMERGELACGDAALAAQVLLGNLMGTVLRRQILRDPGALRYSQQEIAEGIVSMTLQGLLPRE